MTKFIELKGGLGNQLFQYFAGQIIAKESSEPAVFSLPDKSLHKIHQASTILDLELPTIVDTEFLLTSKIASPWNRGRRWLNRNSEISRNLFNRFSDTYTSGTVGFDSKLQKFRGSSFFEGYFQTYRYVSAFQEQTELLLRPKRPSPQYLLYLDRIIERQPTVIHIRRGDYKPLKKTIGILGSEYYRNALRALEEKNAGAPVWLFTDDLQGAEQVIGGLDTEFDQIVSPDTELSAAETMLLMSEAPSIIIANSTFSWWAAYLGSNSREVIAPSPWYRANSIKDELIPVNWKLTNSVWEN
jgi:hypothetical protein